MSLRPDDFLIGDGKSLTALLAPVVGGEPKGRGYVPRDYDLYPQEMFAPPSDMPLYPRGEWSDRIKEMEVEGSSLSHVRNRAVNGKPFPALDQGQEGFCWAYSVCHSVMILRALNHQPYVRLSAHAVGCAVKNFVNEGGWCGLSAQFLSQRGCPSVQAWPEKSMSRAYDNALTWENAAQHRVTEDWVDLTRPVYGRNLTFEQVASCLLSRIPCALDWNWMGHSMCGLDLVEIEPNSFGIRVINSWSSGWGNNGTAVMRSDYATPDGGVALRVTNASTV